MISYEVYFCIMGFMVVCFILGRLSATMDKKGR